MITAEAHTSERRLHRRTQLRMPVTAIRLDPDGGDLMEHLTTADISRGGIGAFSDRPFYPGQRLVLKLPAPGMGVRSVCGVVKRCCPQEGKYRLGIEFAHPIASLWADSSGCGNASAAA